MNKTYMQFIQNYVDYDLNNSATIGEHPIGYMFASFARSHKVSYAEFSKMTAVYLQDQSVSGHSMEYIARQHVAPVLSVDKQQIIIMVHICVRYKTCRFLERTFSWR